MSSDNSAKLARVEKANEPALPSVPERGYGYGYGYGGANEEEGGFDFRHYLRVIYKNKWLIVTIVVIVTTFVSIASRKVESQYTAMATIQVGDPNRASIAETRVVGYDYWGAEKYYQTQINLLQMPELLRKVVVDLDLEHNPKFFTNKPTTLSQAMFSIFRSSPPPAPVTATSTAIAPVRKVEVAEGEDDPLAPYVGTIAGGLDIRDIKNTQLITITFRHHDPEITAKVVNALVDNYVKQNLNERVDLNASASDFLQRRIADLQTSIRTGEERLLNYGKTHEILSLDEKQNTIVDRLAGLNKELLQAETERQGLEATRDAMAKAGAAQDILRLPEAQADPGVAEISRALTVLRQKKLELEQRYTDEYPEVQKVNEQIAALEVDLEKSKTRIAATVEARYQAAVNREKMARNAFEAQRGKTMEQNEAAISYKIIQQEVETNKELLNTLLQRSKEVDISAAATKSNVSPKNKATVPGGPSGPDRNRWVYLAFLLSLIGGVGLAFGRDYLDQTIKSIDDIDRYVRLPSLGVIPALGAGPQRSSKRRKLLGVGKAPPDEGGQQLITSQSAKSFSAEAYRQLRTSVLLSSAGHLSKLLLVTSSQPREGKTTTAVNTAISLAQTGARTLIIDCDMRKPRVHKLLNVDPTIGISMYLSGQTKDWEKLIQEHPIENLSVMPCGPIPPNPAELLGSDTMRGLLERLSEHYDHIVVDTPPVVSFADPVILSTMVDGVMLVVRAGFSTRGIVIRSRQLLSDVGARIFGVVLNDADLKASGGEYYYGAYYYNEYYSDEKGKDDAK